MQILERSHRRCVPMEDCDRL
ncbi:hypothetical protein Bhyg_15828 [Pseudolycoriella hygida]|uniref:Uncharacterized protein n=1 Tax=Pseudolycoriella hygida TaxID=35572 RepID=A0A9Q0MJF8_9DIPT|nr:hypothetical protein Bhyg_15771 [Pseudolycoriella hygida]KAJ6633033.1 hypothetical protein Bhyg_15828 [Pseudolycoriella hygida]